MQSMDVCFPKGSPSSLACRRFVFAAAMLCNQQCSGLFLAMLVSVRLSVVRKGPRSALACLSASSCGGGEEACPLFDGQEGFENKVRACSRRA
ncbi:hypothetical protein ACFX13_023517 [Malus domestica]